MGRTRREQAPENPQHQYRKQRQTDTLVPERRTAVIGAVVTQIDHPQTQNGQTYNRHGNHPVQNYGHQTITGCGVLPVHGGCSLLPLTRSYTVWATEKAQILASTDLIIRYDHGRKWDSNPCSGLATAPIMS